MTKIRRALFHSSIAQYTVTGIGLVSTILVARLLTPAEIGLYAIASAFVMVLNEFRMLGASEYLIRESEVDEHLIRQALGLTIIISWAFAAFLVFGASYFSDFYNKSELEFILFILVPGFLMAPYSSIVFALFSKNLDFLIQLKAKVISNVCMFAVTIGGILYGLSFYSLALGQLSKEIVIFIFAMLYKPPEMRLTPSFKGIGKIASFGINNSGANLIRKGFVIAPDLIIGKLGSVVQVALFSRGLGFVNFLIDTPKMGIAPVILPFLSKSYNDSNSLSASYIKASAMLGALVAPILGVASLASLPTIRFMFGDQWDAAAPIASILCFWGILKTAHWFSNDALAAVRQERLLIFKEILPLIGLIAGIFTLYDGDLEVIAWIFLLVGVLEFILISVLLHYFAGVEIGNYLFQWMKNAVLTLIAIGTCYCLGLIMPFDETPAWQVVGVLALVMPVIWFLSLIVCNHQLYPEIREQIKNIRRKFHD